jgi:hypothetical protein
MYKYAPGPIAKYVASVTIGRKLTTYRFTLDDKRIGSVKNWINISGNTI